MYMWKNNIKMDLTENEWHGVEGIQLFQDWDQKRAFVNR